MKDEFYKYLINKGYTKIEAAECIKRLGRGYYDPEVELELERQRKKIRKD